MKNELQEQFNSVCNAYLVKFAQKHGFKDYHWVADNVGTEACLDGYVFASLEEIRYDIDNGVCDNSFPEWYSYKTDLELLQDNYDERIRRKSIVRVSFKSYCEGAPLPYTPDEIRKMKQACADLWYAEGRLRDTFNEIAE